MRRKRGHWVAGLLGAGWQLRDRAQARGSDSIVAIDSVLHRAFNEVQR